MEKLLEVLDKSGLEIDKVIERFAGSEDMTANFLVKFVEDDSYQKGIDCLATKQYDDVLMAIHTLKGVSGNLGMMKLFDLCQVVVDKIRAKDYDLKADMDNITNEYKRIVKIINENK